MPPAFRQVDKYIEQVSFKESRYKIVYAKVYLLQIEGMVTIWICHVPVLTESKRPLSELSNDVMFVSVLLKLFDL